MSRLVALFGLAMLCASGFLGCRDAKQAELERRLAAGQQENDRLRQQLDEERKRVDEALAANAALAPKVAQLEREVEAARRSLSRISALTPDGMSERMRAEVRRIIQEMQDTAEEERNAERRAWVDDLRSRHMDELVAAAHLSPEQKEKLQLYEEEEQQALRSAYMAARTSRAVAEPINKARERIRQEKEDKIRALLDADQFAKYLEWKRQEADLFRSGLNRRQQSPNANQKDM
jgi:hypothetical protein